MRRHVLIALACLLLGASLFGWGYLAHRNRIFPYWLVRSSVLGGQSSLEEGPAPDDDDRVYVVRGNPAQLDRLQSLPYVTAAPDEYSGAKGVQVHDASKAWSGWNLYASQDESGATLIDMEGRQLHQWHGAGGRWMTVEPLPDGSVVVVVLDEAVIRVGVSSREYWRTPMQAHHDLDVLDERIFAIASETRIEPELAPARPVVDDLLVEMDLDGRVLRETSLLKLMIDSPYRFLLPSVAHLPTERDLDILHTNTVEIFDGSLESISPLFAQGNALVSLRNINCIAILRLQDTPEILWLWGPSTLAFQHHPTALPTGNILVFNNGLKSSEVLEVDPVSLMVEWSYEKNGFFSERMGGSQRLPNGNTLITESDSGRAFEVTPAGKIVWEFLNPSLSDTEQRGAIWRMTRYAEGSLLQ